MLVHTGAFVFSVAFSPDSKLLAAKSADGTIRLWELESGRLRTILAGNLSALLFSLQFSPDGQTLASLNNDEVKLWDVATAQEIVSITGHPNKLEAMVFSPDGKLLATGGHDASVRLWDLSTGPEYCRLDGTPRPSPISFDRISHVISHVLTAPSGKRTIHVWDLASRKKRSIVIPGLIYSPGVLIYSPDGKTLAITSRDKAALWDRVASQLRMTGVTVSDFPGIGPVLAFSPDSQWIVCHGRDQSLKLLEVASGRQSTTFDGHKLEVRAASFSPDGALLASGSDDSSPTCRQAGELLLWDVRNGEQLASLRGHMGGIHCVSFHPDGRLLVSGSDDETIKLWDVASRQPIRTLRGHTASVDCLSFSPDGKTLASGSGDGEVLLWDVTTGQLRATLPRQPGRVTAVVYSPEGSTLVSSYNGRILVWDLSSGPVIATLKGHANTVASAAFTSDGTKLVTTDGDGQSLVWDLRTGQAETGLSTLPDTVPGTVSPDGSIEVRREENKVILIDRKWKKPALPPRLPVLPPRLPPGVPDLEWHGEQAARACASASGSPRCFISTGLSAYAQPIRPFSFARSLRHGRQNNLAGTAIFLDWLSDVTHTCPICGIFRRTAHENVPGEVWSAVGTGQNAGSSAAGPGRLKRGAGAAS